MVKMLTKIGNSHGIVLDRALLDLIGMRSDEAVQITVSGRSVILTPVNPRPVDDATFNRALEEVLHDRREVLRRLAQ